MVIETTIALIIIFATLVIFHELGHFAAARLVGVRVDEFALGFGPKLKVLFKRGDTEYTIHPFPLGGFVKLAGMEPGEEDVPDGYQAQAIWKRALVVFAGPVMSFILAVIIFLTVGVFWGFTNPSNPINVVGQVNPKTEAARIGLRAGDTIREIDGTRIYRGKQVLDYVHANPGKPMRLVVERDGKRMVKRGTPQWSIEWLGANWSFMKRTSAQVEAVVPGSAAAKAGVKPDDVLKAINGKDIRGGADMDAAIRANSAKRVSVDLLRGGKPVALTVVPDIQWIRFAGAKWAFPGAYVEGGNGEISPSSAVGRAGLKPGDEIISVNGDGKTPSGEEMLKLIASGKAGRLELGVKRHGEQIEAALPVSAGDAASARSGYYDAIGLLGFLPKPMLEKAGFEESIARGLRETGYKVVYLVRSLMSEKIKDDIGGPVMIARQTAASVALGPYYVVNVAGMLTLSLAFINLLPIPTLDGGHLALLLAEAIRRKRLSVQQMQAIMAAGLMLIIAIGVLVLWSDIFKITQGLVPQ